jgi:hypothetical protein
MPAATLAAPRTDLVQTPPPIRTLAPIGWFQQRRPAALILAGFPLVAVPMAAAVLLSADSAVLWTYTWLFGMTHFVVTLAVYLRSENLRHFASSRWNILVFFAVPAAIFVLLDLYHALRVGAVFPVAGLFVLGFVRLIDFNHFNRQSFGVLQLFKARSGRKPDPNAKRLENRYFLALTGLIFTTYLSGGTCPWLHPAFGSFFPTILRNEITLPLWTGFAVIAAALFVLIARRVWRDTGSPAAIGYLTVQSLGAAAAAAYFPLYLAALAVHYVEYHVLMAPRCFRSHLDPTSRLDRAYGAVRSRPVIFYAIVIAAAGVVTLCARVGMGMMGHDPSSAGEPFSYLALIAVFDGLFVFHYFVEMFIWRFGDPHFRKELSGLYFAK